MARALFDEAEGVPIGPASGIALAALRKAVELGRIDANDSILLHITGNNDLLVRRDYAVKPIPVALAVEENELCERRIAELRGMLRP